MSMATDTSAAFVVDSPGRHISSPAYADKQRRQKIWAASSSSLEGLHENLKHHHDGAGLRTRPPKAKETDPRRLETRQKQISFGKNTIGYSEYRKAVPK